MLRPSRLAAVVVALALAATLAACGPEHGLEVVEGEPVEVGDLTYTVEMTRFLNPYDVEDAEYLAGLPPPRQDTSYLAVFLRITNESDRDVPSAERYAITDIRDDRYEPVDSESGFALEIGAPVPAEGQLPPPESLAAAGPAAGALLVFLVDDAVIERRPIRLEIPMPVETGEVELDI
jgi:hypothetical protein